MLSCQRLTNATVNDEKKYGPDKDRIQDIIEG